MGPCGGKTTWFWWYKAAIQIAFPKPFFLNRSQKGRPLPFLYYKIGVYVQAGFYMGLSPKPVRGVEGLLGLSPLGLISCLLRGKVKPLYMRRCINLIKQEIRRKTLPSCPAAGKAPQPAFLRPCNPSRRHQQWTVLVGTVAHQPSPSLVISIPTTSITKPLQVKFRVRTSSPLTIYFSIPNTLKRLSHF